MTQTSNCTNTAEAICDGSLPGDSGTHTQYECTTGLLSPVVLESCAKGNTNLAIYWFWYDDVCRVSSTINKHFAVVGSNNSNNTVRCTNIPDISITHDSCVNDYNFTRQFMIIKNVTNSTSQKYICFLANNPGVMNFTSAVIYSINISDPTTSAPTVTTTTSFSTTSQTIDNSEPSPLLTIVLPSAVGVLLIILLIIAVLLYNRRRKQTKKPDDFNLKKIPLKTNQSSDRQDQLVYADDTSVLESDNGYSIWRPVQQKA